MQSTKNSKKKTTKTLESRAKIAQIIGLGNPRIVNTEIAISTKGRAIQSWGFSVISQWP